MPYYEHEKLPNTALKHFNYGFFTNQNGVSDGAYLVNGQPTRNVNIFAPNNSPDKGYDTPEHIAHNIASCIQQDFGQPILTSSRCFFMAPHYAGMTKDAKSPNQLLITVLDDHNIDIIYEKALKESEQFVNLELIQSLNQNKIVIEKSDAIVLKKMSRTDIDQVYIGGFTADAHPIILLDDSTGVCAYMTCSHHVLHQKGLAAVIKTMIEQGANKDQIQVVIGPGLGKHCYEMQDQSPNYQDVHDYFDVSKNSVGSEEILTPVASDKFLLDAPLLLQTQAMTIGLSPTQVHNTNLNTMGYDLYQQRNHQWQKVTQTPRDTEGLFFSARSATHQRELGNTDPFKYHGVGRTASWVGIPKLRPS